MSIAEKITTIVENEQKVYDAGKKSQYDEFWDVFQQNGKRNGYISSFGQGWDDTNFNPKYDFVVNWTNAANFMFQYFQGSNIKKTVIASGGCRLFYAFSNGDIQIIPKLVVDSTVSYDTTFNSAKNLCSITFEGEIAANINFQNSTLLTKDSIVNIINTLSAKTSEKTLSLSKTAVNNAFGINIDDETTYPEGSEFYNLRNSKLNWTFSYI